MVQRWVLHDPDLDESWTFPVNPNHMTSPHVSRSLAILTTPPSNQSNDSQGRVLESNADPYEWSFGGFIRTQAHHDELRRWSKKVNRLELADHLGRTWLIRMVEFDPDEKVPTKKTPWRFDYEIKALNYGPSS